MIDSLPNSFISDLDHSHAEVAKFCNGYRKPAELDDLEMRIVSAASAEREPLYTR